MVVVLGLCVQMSVLPVLGLLVMLWPDRGLGPGVLAHRVLELACGLELRRRWPWTVSGSLLVLLGLGGGGSLAVVFMFTSFLRPGDAGDAGDRRLCPEGV